MDKHELFAKNLEAIRAINGQSIAEFAREAGIPKSTLQSVRISGHTTLDTAIRISEGLGLPLDSLTGDGSLTQSIDIIRYLLRSIDWFQALSPGEQEEILLHFRRILEVIRK